jgi:hypothetical protein
MRFLLRTLSLSYVRRHVAKTLLTLLGVIVGVATFSSIESAKGTLVKGIRSTVDRVAGKSQLQITMENGDYIWDIRLVRLAGDSLLNMIYGGSMANAWYGESSAIDSSFNKIVEAFSKRFEVLPSSNGISAGAYTLVSDLRDEGVTVEQASYARLQRIIDLASCGLLGREKISVLELSHLCHAVEKQLAGSIGTIAAGRTFQKLGEIFDAEEEEELANMYRALLVEMNLSPEELRE